MSSLDVKFFYLAFWLYFAGFITFSLYIPFRKPRIAQIGMWLMGLGLIPQTIAIIIRWATSLPMP